MTPLPRLPSNDGFSTNSSERSSGSPVGLNLSFSELLEENRKLFREEVFEKLKQNGLLTKIPESDVRDLRELLSSEGKAVVANMLRLEPYPVSKPERITRKTSSLGRIEEEKPEITQIKKIAKQTLKQTSSGEHSHPAKKKKPEKIFNETVTLIERQLDEKFNDLDEQIEPPYQSRVTNIEEGRRAIQWLNFQMMKIRQFPVGPVVDVMYEVLSFDPTYSKDFLENPKIRFHLKTDQRFRELVDRKNKEDYNQYYEELHLAQGSLKGLCAAARMHWRLGSAALMSKKLR